MLLFYRSRSRITCTQEKNGDETSVDVIVYLPPAWLVTFIAEDPACWKQVSSGR
jgi:hypothetical protein